MVLLLALLAPTIASASGRQVAALREILRHVTEQGSGEERDIPVMTVPELVRYWGYPVEEHWVTTEDGYILGKLTNILVRSMQN